MTKYAAQTAFLNNTVYSEKTISIRVNAGFGGVLALNLINCAYKCIHQKDGYCTLERLNDNCFTPTADCIYYSEASAKQVPQLSDVFDGDKP